MWKRRCDRYSFEMIKNCNSGYKSVAHMFCRDVIVKPILVLPEGFPVETTTSAFICPKDFSDDSTITWDLNLPDDLVPESARAYVSLIGDILGPALENLDNLVRLPMGCGEQNMILFVPNIHVIGYLDATGVENPGLRAKAIRNMEKGNRRVFFLLTFIDLIRD